MENATNSSVQPTEEIFNKDGGIFFNASEWKFFQLELEDMRNSGGEFDFPKSV